MFYVRRSFHLPAVDMLTISYATGPWINTPDLVDA